MIKNSTILIIGFPNYLGAEIFSMLKKKKYKKILFNENFKKNNINEKYIKKIFKNNKIDYVFLLSGDNGGIQKNLIEPASLISSNLTLSTNVLKYSYLHKVKKLLFLSSSCIYPVNINKKLTPDMFLSGKLEESSQSYAISKIAGMEMCKSYRKQFNCDFISVIPATVYGPEENFFTNNSHVISSLLGRFFLSTKNNDKEISIWGSGKAKRDFIYYKDLADSLIFLMQKYSDDSPINVGVNEPISIRSLSYLIKKISNFKGKIKFDLSKPDGAKIKILNNSHIKKIGWKYKTPLEKGLKITYQQFVKNSSY